MKYGWGNAGYRVFIFQNGIIVLFLVVVFYIVFALQGADRRAMMVMLAIAFASFIVRSTPLAYYYFIPLFILSQIDQRHLKENEQTESDSPTTINN